MSNHNRFVIHNNSTKTLDLFIEPEGVCFPLGEGQEVMVKDVFTTAPLTVRLTTNDAGDPFFQSGRETEK